VIASFVAIYSCLSLHVIDRRISRHHLMTNTAAPQEAVFLRFAYSLQA
jgi:hypothetical protein